MRIDRFTTDIWDPVARIEMEALSCNPNPFLFPLPAPFFIVRGLIHMSMRHQPIHPSSLLALPASNHLWENHWRNPVKYLCGPWKQHWPTGNVTDPNGLEGKQDSGYKWARPPGHTPHPVRRNTAEAGPCKIWVSGWGLHCPGLRVVIEVWMWVGESTWWQKMRGFSFSWTYVFFMK